MSRLEKQVVQLKLKNKELAKTAKQYERAFNILIEYWDSIDDEEKPKVDKRLKRLGL